LVRLLGDWIHLNRHPTSLRSRLIDAESPEVVMRLTDCVLRSISQTTEMRSAEDAAIHRLICSLIPTGGKKIHMLY